VKSHLIFVHAEISVFLSFQTNQLKSSMININGSKIFVERKQVYFFAPPQKKNEK
jgi:hypothetical protein